MTKSQSTASHNQFDVIGTLNHHLLVDSRLEQLAQLGATIFRVNGSHVSPQEIKRYSDAVRKTLGRKVRLLVDLPGNKIRTALLPEPLRLIQGELVTLDPSQINYPNFYKHLSQGDVIFANDSLFHLTVEKIDGQTIVLRSHSDGLLTSNKGLHAPHRELQLPFLFERDHALIEEAKKYEFDYVGFSFVRTASEVDEAQATLRGTKVQPIIKIETSAAIRNLATILPRADMFLVDRGDLAADTGIERVHILQNRVLAEAKALGKKIFFATQFFHYMVENRVPLVAEVCGLSDSVERGVDGIQLSEEVAIGKHPDKILEMIAKVRAEVKKTKTGFLAQNSAPVLWLTGLSGSGKTTISEKLKKQLESQRISCCLIDGDEFRAFWGNEAGYSTEERQRNQRNIIFTAHMASRSFDCVIVSSLSPFQALRDLAREKLINFHEIFIDCDLETCIKRDPKGNYGKAASGNMGNYVGVSQSYEPPLKPELTINTSRLTLDESVVALERYLLG